MDSSPPPLSTCYQTDHQPCPGTSEELTREDNQERQSPCPAVCVIPPTPPVCACGGTVKVEGGLLSPGGRPTLLTQQAGTHPPFPATWPHDHPAGPTTTTWEPPDHQVPPESLKQGQELAIPTSAAVAVSAPVMTLALVLVRQKPGGFVPRLALARSLVPTRNTFLPLLHTHTTTMPTPLTGRQSQGCPGNYSSSRCPGSPLCVGGQGAQGAPSVHGGPSKGNGSLTKNARCGLAQGLLHNCCGPKICQHVLGRSKMYCLT